MRIGQEQVDTIGHYLSALEAREGLPIGSIRLLAIATETPAAVLALSGGGLSHPRLFGLLWGAEDLSRSLAPLAREMRPVVTHPHSR
ncbi:hypothetical protein [Fodinicurvata halophila]|uniref:hypothetical protein n=1 Tax=Fodinicurvata halophila TaxID=1419723 RepID=UPI00362CF19E